MPIKVGSPLHIFTRGGGWALATLEANVLILLKWLHSFFFNELRTGSPKIRMWAILTFFLLQPSEHRWLVLMLLSLIILMILGCPLSTSCSSSCCHGFAMVALHSSSVLIYIFLPLGCSHLEDEYELTQDILFTVCSPTKVRHSQLT